MKRFFTLALIVATTITIPVLAADVGVSINIGQPGFYGRLDIGNFPQPQLINRQPIVIERVLVSRPPIYLRVPPGHAKHWGKHCRDYNACGERVFFVRDSWYNNEFVPRYQKQHRIKNRGDRRGEQRGDRGKHQKNGRSNKDQGRGH